jgi:hypothetical protein
MFSAEEKKRILEETDCAVANGGGAGAILRREGINSSSLHGRPQQRLPSLLSGEIRRYRLDSRTTWSWTAPETLSSKILSRERRATPPESSCFREVRAASGFDVSLNKQMRLREGMNLAFRAGAINFLNAPVDF